MGPDFVDDRSLGLMVPTKKKYPTPDLTGGPIVSQFFGGKCPTCNSPFNRRHARHIYCTKACTPQPKPLLVPAPRRLPTARALTNQGISVEYLDFAVNEIYPIYTIGNWSVYEMRAGVYEVHRNGEADRWPFSTIDQELARIVCEAFHREGL